MRWLLVFCIAAVVAAGCGRGPDAAKKEETSDVAAGMAGRMAVKAFDDGDIGAVFITAKKQWASLSEKNFDMALPVESPLAEAAFFGSY